MTTSDMFNHVFLLPIVSICSCSRRRNMMFTLSKVIILVLARCEMIASTVRWPSGTYSLPKPKSGCPESWKEGWIRQNLQDNGTASAIYKSKFSSNFHMNATLKKALLKRNFCSKIYTGAEKRSWPKGKYCIYRRDKSCPRSMVGGSIRWDNEDDKRTGTLQGYIPDFAVAGYPFGDIRLNYCCQNQGTWDRAIEMPTENPFYLLPYRSRNCQRVKWAVSSLEYIVYDTEDRLNGDKFTGHYVYTDKVKSLPKIFYCYYEGCQYKLENETGSFKSPSLFNNTVYPDFQACSWSITVNTTLTISLKFPILDIPNCEEKFLDIYDVLNGSTFLLTRLCGVNATSGVEIMSKTSHLIIVLNSGNNSIVTGDDSSKSAKFLAEYKAVHPGAVTSTATMLPTSTTKTQNDTFYNGTKNIQKESDDNSSLYVSIVLPITALIVLLGLVAAVFYWKRRTKKSDHATGMEEKKIGSDNPSSQIKASGSERYVSLNPIYDSQVESAYENESMKMHEATDNVLYEPGNEILTGNPIYELEDEDDGIYTEPNES